MEMKSTARAIWFDLNINKLFQRYIFLFFVFFLQSVSHLVCILIPCIFLYANSFQCPLRISGGGEIFFLNRKLWFIWLNTANWWKLIEIKIIYHRIEVFWIFPKFCWSSWIHWKFHNDNIINSLYIQTERIFVGITHVHV